MHTCAASPAQCGSVERSSGENTAPFDGDAEMLGTPEQIVERFVELADAGLDGTVLLFPL